MEGSGADTDRPTHEETSSRANASGVKIGSAGLAAVAAAAGLGLSMRPPHPVTAPEADERASPAAALAWPAVAGDHSFPISFPGAGSAGWGGVGSRPVEVAHPALTLVLALAVGVVAQSLARHVRVPGIVLLLVAGVALGPDGLGWVQPLSLGDGLFAIVDLAVAVILFEGGLNLQISRLRREQASIRRLVTVGALVTLLGGALAVHTLFDWSWVHAMLFGSLVVVTGPTVVGPLVESLRLRTRVATVLEAEGVLIDPIGAIVAVVMLGVALSPDDVSLQSGAFDLVSRLPSGSCPRPHSYSRRSVWASTSRSSSSAVRAAASART